MASSAVYSQRLGSCTLTSSSDWPHRSVTWGGAADGRNEGRGARAFPPRRAGGGGWRGGRGGMEGMRDSVGG